MSKSLIPSKNTSEKDLVWTPPGLAKKIIADLNPSGLILDPCRGPGAFYDNFPAHCEKDWCELSEGRDFFEYKQKVDWIITNPPWSIQRSFAKHAYTIADNTAFLITITSELGMAARVRDMVDAGFGVKAIYFYDQPKTDWPQSGFQLAVVHKQKGYKGVVEMHNLGCHGKTDY